MVLQVKVLGANLNELSSIPKPHIVEEKMDSYKLSSASHTQDTVHSCI